MTKADMVRMCREKGIDYSEMQLHRIGKQVGFIEKVPGKYFTHYDEDKFNEWLNNVEVNIPEDCMYIQDAVKEYGVQFSILQYHLIKNGAEIKTGGYRKEGRRYAKKSDIERVVEEYNKRAERRRSKND